MQTSALNANRYASPVVDRSLLDKLGHSSESFRCGACVCFQDVDGSQERRAVDGPPVDFLGECGKRRPPRQELVDLSGKGLKLGHAASLYPKSVFMYGWSGRLAWRTEDAMFFPKFHEYVLQSFL